MTDPAPKALPCVVDKMERIMYAVMSSRTADNLHSETVMFRKQTTTDLAAILTALPAPERAELLAPFFIARQPLTAQEVTRWYMNASSADVARVREMVDATFLPGAEREKLRSDLVNHIAANEELMRANASLAARAESSERALLESVRHTENQRRELAKLNEAVTRETARADEWQQVTHTCNMNAEKPKAALKAAESRIASLTADRDSWQRNHARELERLTAAEARLSALEALRMAVGEFVKSIMNTPRWFETRANLAVAYGNIGDALPPPGSTPSKEPPCIESDCSRPAMPGGLICAECYGNAADSGDVPVASPPTDSYASVPMKTVATYRKVEPPTDRDAAIVRAEHVALDAALREDRAWHQWGAGTGTKDAYDDALASRGSAVERLVVATGAVDLPKGAPSRSDDVNADVVDGVAKGAPPPGPHGDLPECLDHPANKMAREAMREEAPIDWDKAKREADALREELGVPLLEAQSRIRSLETTRRTDSATIARLESQLATEFERGRREGWRDGQLSAHRNLNLSAIVHPAACLTPYEPHTDEKRTK